jgi:hypothetical protein
MEMPNTMPNALTQTLLEDKYQIAAQTSVANYSFFMGASNDNYDEAMKTDTKNVCGLKIFMGSSTGNMLVDDKSVLTKIFSNFSSLIATHCEDEATVKANLTKYKEQYGENLPYDLHAIIRNEEACYKSSSMAVELAKKHGTRLHILHISTADEISLFSNVLYTKEKPKNITSEVCIHHLWFDAEDYNTLGKLILICNDNISKVSLSQNITIIFCSIRCYHKNSLYEKIRSIHRIEQKLKVILLDDDILRLLLICNDNILKVSSFQNIIISFCHFRFNHKNSIYENFHLNTSKVAKIVGDTFGL